MAFEIVTDSACNLTNDIIEEYDLHILPLVFRDETGKEYFSYQNNKKLDLGEFYSLMREGTVFTTSLPNLASAKDTFCSILDRGVDVLYIGFSSGLSGTYQAICQLMDSLSAEYPERKLAHVDTFSAAGGQGQLVYHAAKLAQSGAAINAVEKWVKDNQKYSAHWFTVEDLMYLFRGGRVSKSSAWAGNLLNIKPVLNMNEEGKLVPMEKIRGRKKSLNALVSHMKDNIQQPYENQVVFINHGDCLEEAEYVADKIREEFGITDIHLDMLDPVIGAHTGPGLVALFFMAKGRN